MLKKIFQSSFFCILFIFLFPFVVALFVNFEFIDWGVFLISFLWLFPLFTPFYLFRKRVVFVFGIILIFLIGVIDLIHWYLLGGPLSIATIFVVFETNSSEAEEFLDTFVDFKLMCLILFYVASSFFLIVRSKPMVRRKYLNVFVSIGISLFFLIFIQKYSIGRADLAYPSVVDAITAYRSEILSFREKASKVDVDLSKLKVKSSDSNLEEIHVLVIGESLNRNHMSLYGSEVKTTPILDSLSKQLYVYRDVISANTTTLASLKLALTQSNYDNNTPYYNSYSLIDVAKAAGFKTFWLSNQSPIGVWDNEVSVLANTSDEVSFMNKTSGSRAVNLISYDEKLLFPFENVLKQSDPKKFIVLHMMGSHISYKKRYPKQFRFYKVKEGEGEETAQRKQYYNSVRYTDYILTEILEMLKAKENLVSTFTFMSDHGENVYDEYGDLGHGSNKLSRHHLEIPFLVWLSDSYKIHYKEKTSLIKESLNKPFFCDDFFHSQIDLMNLKTDVFVNKRSLYDSSFVIRERKVSNKDYDLELKNK